jgi:hypothetical protein
MFFNRLYASRHAMPPTFDDAWYLENSCLFLNALKEGGLWAAFKAFAASFKFKAPLISALAVPFYLAAGPSLEAALCVNLLALAILCAYLFLLGREAGGEACGLSAVLIAMTMPMLLGLSRRFLVEFPLAAAVAASAYHLLASDDLRKPAHCRALGILLGLGLLLKSIFPFYLLAPALEALWRRRRDEDLGRSLRSILYPGLAIASTWYAWNLVYVAGYVVRASFGDIASHYGSRSIWSPGVVWGYWKLLIADGPSTYHFLAAAGLGIFLASRGAWRRAWERPATRLCLLWLGFPLLVATFGVNKDIRFMTPCLPALAVLLAWGLEQTLPRWALAVFFLVPIDQFALQTLGRGLALGGLVKRNTSYSNPPSREGQWRQGLLVERIASYSGTATVALGLEHGHLNANNLSYLSARAGLKVRFVSYGYAETRIEAVVLRLLEKDADFLLRVDGVPPGEIPESVRALETQVRSRVDSGALPFAFLEILELAPGITASIYRRTGPIRLGAGR